MCILVVKKVGKTIAIPSVVETIFAMQVARSALLNLMLRTLKKTKASIAITGIRNRTCHIDMCIKRGMPTLANAAEGNKRRYRNEYLRSMMIKPNARHNRRKGAQRF